MDAMAAVAVGVILTLFALPFLISYLVARGRGKPAEQQPAEPLKLAEAEPLIDATLHQFCIDVLTAAVRTPAMTPSLRDKAKHILTESGYEVRAGNCRSGNCRTIVAKKA